jgi:thioredoxin 1
MQKIGCLLVLLLSLPLQHFGIDNPKEKAKKAVKSNLLFYDGSYKQALAKAKAEGKMILVDSYTRWCAPCKVMKNVYLQEENLAEYLNEHFVCLRLDAEKGDGLYLRRKFPHGTFPSLLFIKNNGKLKNKFVGLPTYGAMELLNFAKLSRQF